MISLTVFIFFLLSHFDNTHTHTHTHTYICRKESIKTLFSKEEKREREMHKRCIYTCRVVGILKKKEEKYGKKDQQRDKPHFVSVCAFILERTLVLLHVNFESKYIKNGEEKKTEWYISQ